MKQLVWIAFTVIADTVLAEFIQVNLIYDSVFVKLVMIDGSIKDLLRFCLRLSKFMYAK
jgi:predicted TIM-barrel enzyme